MRLAAGHILGTATECEVIHEGADALATELPGIQSLTGTNKPADSTSASVVPPHLIDLYERSVVSPNEDEAGELAKLLTEFADVFATHDADLGKFSVIQHKIDTGNARPVRQPMRHTPVGFNEEEEKHLKQMLESEIIQPSLSKWASPPVLVRKRDGFIRWCIDYRALNQVTVKDASPMPRIEECLDTITNTRYMSTLDLASGYWQLEVDPKDRHKTAFINRYRLFEHIRMRFGLCNAPATFSRAMQIVLSGLLWENVLAYLDDVIVVGRTFRAHLHNLREISLRFWIYN